MTIVPRPASTGRSRNAADGRRRNPTPRFELVNRSHAMKHAGMILTIQLFTESTIVTHGGARLTRAPHGDRVVECDTPNHRKSLFSTTRATTKLDRARYTSHWSPAPCSGAGGRPNVLGRYPDGLNASSSCQSGLRSRVPAWSRLWRCSSLRSPAPKKAVPRYPSTFVGCQPRRSRASPPPGARGRSRSPDELRANLDPSTGPPWPQVREVPWWCGGARISARVWPKNLRLPLHAFGTCVRSTLELRRGSALCAYSSRARWSGARPSSRRAKWK